VNNIGFNIKPCDNFLLNTGHFADAMGRIDNELPSFKQFFLRFFRRSFTRGCFFCRHAGEPFILHSHERSECLHNTKRRDFFTLAPYLLVTLYHKNGENASQTTYFSLKEYINPDFTEL